ncbi:MAG: transcription antitermination factor NusB, partial [Kiritimatiellaeota bacterium]|nr:transcription antitermination factor NusB [Kiritimatiellota bacterium]
MSPRVTRRDAREWALQILFWLDMNPVPDDADMEAVFEEFWSGQLRQKLETQHKDITHETFTGAWRNQVGEKRLRKFTETLVLGVREHRKAIDDLLIKYAENWDITRFGGSERNALRIGIYELKFAAKPTPIAVAINEAVDVAKFFGAQGGGRFVNGILD